MTPRPPWHENEQLIAMLWCVLAAVLYMAGKLTGTV